MDISPQLNGMVNLTKYDNVKMKVNNVNLLHGKLVHLSEDTNNLTGKVRYL